MQPQSLNTHTEVYDQIQLSPSTGQSELVSKNESEDTNTFTSTTPNHHHMQTNVTETNSESLEAGKHNSEDVTYAVVDKTKKKKEESTQGQENIEESII